MNTHSVILKNDSTAFVVELNPIAFEPFLYKGVFKPQPKTTYLAFNVNYSFGKYPIGIVKDPERSWLTISVKTKIRPVLGVDSLARKLKIGLPTKEEFNLVYYDYMLQGGPSLVKNGERAFPLSLEKEEFRDDVCRKTKHVAIGTKKIGEDNKLFVGFFHNSTLTEITEYFESLGCENVMNCDGGSAAHLAYRDSTGTYKFGNPKAAAGIQFVR